MVGSVIFDEDFILQLLFGLLLEYDVVVANLNSSPTLHSIAEVQSLLLNQEIQIQQFVVVELPSANVANKNKSDSHGSARDFGSIDFHFGQMSHNRGRSTYRGRSRG